MLPHILLLLYFLCTFPGVAVIGFNVYFSRRFRHRGWMYYTILTSSLFLLFFSEILDIYGTIANVPGLLPSSLFSIFTYRILLQILWVIFPLFLFQLFQLKIPNSLLVVVVVTSFLFPLSAFPGISHRIPWLRATGEIVFFTGIAFWCFQAYRWMKNLHITIVRNGFLSLSTIILVFLPLAFFDQQRLTGISNDISLPLFFFYLVWSLYNLRMVRKWFIQKGGIKGKESVQSFCTTYGISGREEEIILSIIRGQTNKEIAYDMGISEKTVKNHIYSIFRKSGVQSRMLLLIRIQSFS